MAVLRPFTLSVDATSHWAEFLALVGWPRPPVLMDGCDGVWGDLDPVLSTMIRDLAMPPKWRLKPEQTLFLGPADAWAGRLVIDMNLSPDEACLFYQERMPGLGWRMIRATVQAPISSLAFVCESRATSIQLEPRKLFGCTATLILLPHRDSASRFGIIDGSPDRNPEA